jgi:hypothetical protein
MIVLLTDFGLSEYVGVMKGVIFGIAGAVRVVDLCHAIAGQSVIEGSWVLKNNYKYFPKGAVSAYPGGQLEPAQDGPAGFYKARLRITGPVDQSDNVGAQP